MLPIITCVSISLAGTATQTDWAGGAGIPGPVTDWGDEFSTGTGIQYFADPSNVVLHKSISGAVLEYTVDGDFDSARSVYSADINSDGYMDVLGAASGLNAITWWENVDGSGTSWTEHTVDGDFVSAMSVYSADINGDGYMDVLGAASIADDVTWWENDDGSGTGWTEHTVDADFDSAISVYSEDINGDGYLDILGAAWVADDIAWWNCGAFLPAGSLESSILDVQESPDWQILLWTSTEQAGTDVRLQIRASKDPFAMGSWSDTLTAPCMIDEIINDGDSLFQYRVILNTSSPYATPLLHDVIVTWLPLTGTHEESAGEITSYALFGAQPNPSYGYAALIFALPVEARAEFSVYDLSGRLVKFISDDFSQGVKEIVVDGLASGVYIVRMISGEFTATRQLVIIE